MNNVYERFSLEVSVLWGGIFLLVPVVQHIKPQFTIAISYIRVSVIRKSSWEKEDYIYFYVETRSEGRTLNSWNTIWRTGGLVRREKHPQVTNSRVETFWIKKNRRSEKFFDYCDSQSDDMNYLSFLFA